MITRYLWALSLAVVCCSYSALHAQQWTPLGPDDNNWPCDLTFGNDGFVLDQVGNPVIAYRGYYLDYGITVRRWSGSHWYAVGPVGFANSNGNPCLASDAQGGFFVAYQDPDNGYRISVRHWTNGTWQFVGLPGFTVGQASPSGLEVDAQGRPVVAFADITQGYRVSVWHWNGINWESIGSPGFSAGGVAYLDMAVDSEGNPVVAYRDNWNGKRTTVQRWSGNGWDLVGVAGFSPDSANFQSIALDQDGNPIVAYQEIGLTYHNKTTVQRWDGTSWVFTGPRGFSMNWSRSQRIAAGPGGEIIVAYLSDSFDGYHVTVRKWSGAEWQPYGSEGPQGLFSMGLAIRSTGTPIVAYTNLSYGSRTTVQSWNGGSWEVLGDLGFSVEGAIAEADRVSLALEPSGRPVVAYSDGAHYNRLTVRRWNGAAWQLIGPAGFAVSGSSSCLALDSGGRPYVAHQEGTYGRATVHRWTGSAWETVGPAQFSALQAKNLCLAVDVSGRPIVAYQDVANGSRTTVQRWNGTNWEMMGPSGVTTTGVAGQCLVLGHDGTPFVAHNYGSGGIRVHRWDGSSWQALGLVTSSNHPYPLPSLALDRAGNPIVTYLASQFGAGATVKRWNGSDWELLGPQGLTSVYARSLCLATDTTGATLLAYRNPDTDGATVLRWNEESWEVIGSQEITGSLTADARRWMEVDKHGRIVIAYVSGGAYAKAYPDADYGIISIDGELNIGPNPSTGEDLWVSLGGLPSSMESMQAELHDMSGRRVSAQVLPVAYGELNSRLALPSALASGMYVVSVTGQDSRWSARLIVAKP